VESEKVLEVLRLFKHMFGEN